MRAWDFPQVGPAWFNTLFYFTLATYIKFVESVYALVDRIFGGLV